MTQPTLLTVPKDSPSRKERIEAFKKRHNIETHSAGPSWGRENHPWSACWMTLARKFGYGVTETSELFDCVAKVGRLLEEADVLVTGETEREAIKTLCEKNNIPFDL